MLLNRVIPYNQKPFQPQINWANPVTQGLVSLLTPENTNFFNTDKVPWTISNRFIGKAGIAANINSGRDDVTPRPLYKPTGSFTLLTYAIRTGYPASTQTCISTCWNGGTNAFGSGFIEQFSDGRRQGWIATNNVSTPSVSFVPLSNQGSWILNRPVMQGWSWNGNKVVAFEDFEWSLELTVPGGGTPVYPTSVGFANSGIGPNSFLRCYWMGLWYKAMDLTEMRSFVRNPWQVFTSRDNKIWTAGAIGFIGAPITIRPLTDVTTTGWTSTEETLAGSINEISPNDLTFITSPGIDGSQAAATLTLSSSLNPGVWDISLRATSVPGIRSVRVILLDASNTNVGTSSWQLLTGSFATYTLTVTNSVVATKIRIEVQ